VQGPRTGSPLSPASYLTTTFLVLTSFSFISWFLCTDLFFVYKKVFTSRPPRTRYALCFLALSFADSLPYIPPIPSEWFTTLNPHFSLAFTHFFTSQTHLLHLFQGLLPIVFVLSVKGRVSFGPLMPSYTYSRGIPPPAKKETLGEVKARIKHEIQERTTARVRYWAGLAEWCNRKPGRFVRVNWGSKIGTASSEGSSCGEMPH
jgi:hypothetical protein